MPRAPRFQRPLVGGAALTLAMAVLLLGAVVLAARASEPEERRVAWRGVSLVLPGGFVATGRQNEPFAVFQDRLRAERELRVFRLEARPGSAGEAEMEADAPGAAEGAAGPEAAAAGPGEPAAGGFPAPEAILRYMFPRLLGGLRLPPDAAIAAGVKEQSGGDGVPFAVWTGVTGNPDAEVGRATRVLVGVMVTTNGAGSYAVMTLRDPAYRQEELENRLRVAGGLLERTLETVRFRGAEAAPAGAAP